MKLFAIGNAHVAAAMAVNNHIVATDGSAWMHGERAHPDNLQVAWCTRLSELLKMQLEIAPVYWSNSDIIDTTTKWMDKQVDSDYFIVIGWCPTQNLNEIFNFHLYLKECGVKHIFFDTFDKLQYTYKFDENYLEDSYTEYLLAKGYETVITSDEYFGKEAHSEWTKYILRHIVKNGMM